MSASTEVTKAPPLEHITQNYFSLKSVILSVTDRCGKELANVLRTTENLPNDAARKEQFLRFVVACRQEYVKLYVLCKWAVVSGEISRSIDVANWLHGQINCFNNVVGALYNLQSSLGPAKSPWADLETALQVLNLGHPFPPPEAEAHLPETPMSEAEVLRLLKRLDVLIALRLALHEQIPLHYRNYVVHNGRARFHLGNGILWVEFSIADEAVETATRFFYVDCGLNHENTELNNNLRLKIESTVNQQLTQKGLVDVLDWLSYVAALFRLQLLERQLAAMERGAGPWANVVSHRFSSTSLKIRYFLYSTDPGEIQISLSDVAPFDLLVEPRVEVNPNATLDGLADRILYEATKTHASKLITAISAPFITAKTDLSVSLELSPYKYTDLSIDSTSGKFVLAGQGPLINSAQKKINDGQDAVSVLHELRTQVSMETIAARAEASGWQARRNIKLPSDELSKIAPHTSLLALSLPNSSRWSLCIALGGQPELDPRWFACRLTSLQGRWVLQSINDIRVNLNLADPDYSLFAKLIGSHQRHIMVLEVLRELESGNVRFGVKQRDGENVSIVIDITTILPESSKWSHSGLLLTGEAGNQISIEGRAQTGKLISLGKFENPIGSTLLTIDGETGVFKITTNEKQDTLHALTETLKQLHHTALSLVAASSLGVKVKSVTLEQLEFQYAEPAGRIFVQYGQQITFADDNPQKFLSPFLPAISDYTHSSLSRTVAFLQQSYPICELVTRLQTSMPQLKLSILPHSMNQMRIHVGTGLEKPYLDVTLRDFRRKAVVYYITGGNSADQHPEIAKCFKSGNKLDGKVVPLVSGCAVTLQSVHVIQSMLQALGNEA